MDVTMKMVSSEVKSDVSGELMFHATVAIPVTTIAEIEMGVHGSRSEVGLVVGKQLLDCIDYATLAVAMPENDSVAPKYIPITECSCSCHTNPGSIRHAIACC